MGTMVGRASVRRGYPRAWPLTTAIALLVVPLVAGHAGDGYPTLAISGLIVPLEQVDVAVSSASVDIRLLQDNGLMVAVRMECELVSAEDEATDVTVCLPLHGDLEGITYRRGDYGPRAPAAKFDGTPIGYSCADLNELEKPYLDRWAADGWRFLQELDPLLARRLRALDASDADETTIRRVVAAHIKLHARRYGDRTLNWIDSVIKLLLYRDTLGATDMVSSGDLRKAMCFLDPEYTGEKYQLSEVLLEDWGVHEEHMCDPYDGRLYWNRSVELTAYRLEVLKFRVRLEPGESHRLVVFYKMAHGRDQEMYRPGDAPSRQFCITLGNSRKWRDWHDLDVSLHWPEGIEAISYRPRYPRDKRYWREAGYHNASFRTWMGSRNVHVARTVLRPPPRPDDYLAQ